MSVPNGSSTHLLDRNRRDEMAAHRAKVIAALSHHSDPTLRQIGRLLATGVLTPHELLDDPRRAARKPVGADPVVRPAGGSSHDLAGTARDNEGGPASRPDHTDPDNGAGGVPAVRR